MTAEKASRPENPFWRLVAAIGRTVTRHLVSLIPGQGNPKER